MILMKVLNDRSESVKVQVSPVFIGPHKVSDEEFDLSFLVSIPPLGMSTYMVELFSGSLQENT